MLHRRAFLSSDLQSAAAAGLAVTTAAAIPAHAAAAPAAEPSEQDMTQWPVAIFTKVFQKHRYARPAPLSLHVEHLGQEPLAPEATTEMIAASRRDVSTLRSWMQQ